MKDSTEKFISFISLLGTSADIGDFDSRVTLQKLAYILGRILGKELYTDFNFYIKGPYSRELAKEYFSNQDAFSSPKLLKEIKGNEKSEIERVKPILNTLNPRQLEIVASLMYLQNVQKFSEEEAEHTLKNLKPHLQEEEIWVGSNNVKRLLLNASKAKELTEKVNEEMKSWDAAAEELLSKLN